MSDRLTMGANKLLRPTSGCRSPVHQVGFFRRSLPDETIAALARNVLRGLGPGLSREVTFTPWGGAYNSVAADATAFVHRHELLLVQHLFTVDADADPGRRSVRDWLMRSWTLVHPWGSGGVYPKLPDPDLQNWRHAYYGTNYKRLLRIKAK